MKLKVVELFAGVGGFRLGLEKHNFKVIWSNQFEPTTKTQHASMVYENIFGKDGHVNIDINDIDINDIPDYDLLCGGFPCQDYSVAATSNNSKGLEGKKGVLWWNIYNILNKKENKPKYILLENVDRLLKSPTKQRGRDFAIMLKSLNDLGYCVEWRVINAAEYGMPQRRKRVFIIGYHNSTNIFKQIDKNHNDWILSNSTIEKAFNSTIDGNITSFTLEEDIIDIQNGFKYKKSPFLNSGLMINANVYTLNVKEKYKGKHTLLKDVLVDNPNKEFYIEEKDKPRWEYLKGSKHFNRVSKDGHKYKYSEGKMTYPDDINKPSRTIITGEGGKSPSRFKHIIEDKNGLRRLTPIELERLNMFPDNHTKLDGISDTKRAFFMGNALVVGVVERLAKSLERNINFFNS